MKKTYLVLLLIPVLSGGPQLGAQPSESPQPSAARPAASEEFPVDFSYYSDTLGKRLIVIPSAPAGSPAASLELRISDEAFYSPELYDFDVREIANITGPGMTGSGLIFVVANEKAREEFLALLDRFVEQGANFRRRKSELSALEQPWMGQGESTLQDSEIMGEVQLDLARKPTTATLNWDMGKGRLWMSLDGLINIDSTLAEPLSELIERIPEYAAKRSQLEAELAEANEKIGQTLNVSIPSVPPRTAP